jgi:hypothetical protein
MKNDNQKIVSFAEFKRARQPIKLSDVEQFVRNEQNHLRVLDQAIAAHLLEKRKLKDIERLRKLVGEINGRLLESRDWLDEESVDGSDTAKTASLEKLRKLTGQLLARSEVTRKTLVDDMANVRYYEQRWLLDPVKFVGLVLVAPISIDTFIEKFITNKHHIGLTVGKATIAVGLYLTFKSHADAMVKAVHKNVKQAPVTIRAFAVASSLELSMRAKPISQIEPNLPKERPGIKRALNSLER